MRRVPLILVVISLLLVLLVWKGQTGEEPQPPSAAAEGEWAGLDPQVRCESAAALITAPDRWRMVCRWRNAGERLQGIAFPPPKGPPPYDDPHIQIFVAPSQSREDLATAIAHELGHMHHTREPAFAAADWLAARNLPGETPSEIWTEDYAEVFAALFSPPADHWRAPTPRPSAQDLMALKGRFFS